MIFHFHYMFEYPFDIKPEIKYSKNIKIKNKIFQKYQKLENYITKFYDDDKLKEITKNINLITQAPEKDAILYLSLPYKFPVMMFEKYDINIKKDRPIIYDPYKNTHIKVSKTKFKALKTNVFSTEVYYYLHQYKGCDKHDKSYMHRLKTLYFLYDYLEVGGMYYTNIKSFCDLKEMEFIYVLSLLFRKVYFIGFEHVYCIDFLGEERISKKEFETLLKKKLFILNQNII